MTKSTQITYPKETLGVFSHAVTLYLNKKHVCNKTKPNLDVLYTH